MPTPGFGVQRMKQLTTALAFLVAVSTHGQLVNGSFEVNGNFTLDGWEWSCEGPEGWLEAPPGGGDWSAFKEAGHAKGCFPSFLYQRLMDVPYGQPLQLSGWARCPVGDVVTCIGATIGFGVINSGVITQYQTVTSTDENWTFLNVSTVFDPGFGDTAIVLLSAGITGGPLNSARAGFDQLTLDLAQGMGEVLSPHVVHYPDPVSDVLNIAITEGRMLSIDVLDEAGRIVLTASGGTGTRQVAVGSLPPGTYIGRVFTDRGEQRFPFVKP